MNVPDLSIIVVSYNTREMTLECIRSVFSETENTDFELIVLDNASNDGTVRAIESEFGGKLQLIVSAENLGFAVGNNQAANVAKGEYLLLLNPDTVILDEAIDHLYKFACKQSDAGIWGGRTIFSDGSLNIASCWSQQSIWSLLCQSCGLTSIFRKSNLFNPEGMGGWNRDGTRKVDIVSGCFFLIKTDLWRSLGGFRDIFFMYGEEADLCLRAHEYGARPIVTSDATIIHHGGASEKVRVDKMVRLLRAKALLIQFHFPPIQRWLGLRLLFFWPISRYVAHSILAIVGRSASSEPSRKWKDILSRKSEWSMLEVKSDNEGSGL